MPKLTIDEFLDNRIEILLEDDSFYLHKQTPLKSANQLKDEHRKQLKEFLKLDEIHHRVDNAKYLIHSLLPNLVDQETFAKIEDELEHTSEHFSNFLQSVDENTIEDENPIIFQKVLHLSDETLLHFYDLACDLVHQQNYKDANDIFLFLSILAPHITGYWIGQGACLQALGQFKEALDIYNIVKFLNPTDPAPLAYSIEIYQLLNDKEQAAIEFTEFEKRITLLNGEEFEKWNHMVKDYNRTA